jgi:uncharacterized protein (TIGR00369 family)
LRSGLLTGRCHEARRKLATMTETLFDRLKKPPCAELLGWTLLDHDKARGWARLSFEGRPQFLNPAGHVQGGLLSAMLDDAMGPAVLLMTEGEFYTVTLDLNVSFLAPAKPGRLVAEGQVIQLGKTIAFLEARLTDSDETLVAKATSTARLAPTGRLPPHIRLGAEV